MQFTKKILCVFQRSTASGRRLLGESLLVCLIPLGLIACGDDNDHEAETEDPAEHACLQVGIAGTAITAAPDPASAPLLALSDASYTVSLPSGTAGYLRLEGPAEALLFVGTANVVTGLFHGDETESELPATSANEFCSTAIPEHFDLDLHEAGSFYLKLGPAALPSVWLMYAPAAGHGH